MTTVFTLAGAFGNPAEMLVDLQGEVTAGNTVVPINYPNDILIYWPGTGIGDSNVRTGAKMLNEAINDIGGEMVAFGHSLGAVVCNRWLADYGPSCGVSPEQLSFILIGDSMRRYGGMIYEMAGLAANAVAAPVDTPYPVLDIARQWEGWSDWPTNNTNPDYFNALFNAIDGANTLHNEYNVVSLNDPTNLTYVQGNISYVINPTVIAPLYAVEWWYSAAQQEALTNQNRAAFEAAYNRAIWGTNVVAP
jgi:hypothetical protein